MSSGFDDIRAGFAAALDGVGGLTAYACWPKTCEATLPACAPVMARQDFDADMSGDATLIVDVIVLAARASVGFEAGQAAVDVFLAQDGTASVKAALEMDPTLDGTVQAVNVKYWDDYRWDWKIAPDGPEHWGVRFRCEVFL